MRWLCGVLLLMGMMQTGAGTAEPEGIAVTVRETAGLRRFGYPVSFDVPLPRGALRSAANTALEQGERPVRAQYDVRSRWPDGSVQWLMVSFNLSPGPHEKQEFRLRFGTAVSHPDPGPGVVRETRDSFVIRDTYTVPKDGHALATSIRYGGELLDAPLEWRLNGMILHQPEVLSETVHARVVAPGPINVVLELRGEMVGPPSLGRVTPFRITLTQPDSKSWIDAAFESPNADGMVRSVAFSAGYRIEKSPVMFDFGVGSWVYGTLKEDERAFLGVGGFPSRPARWKLFTRSERGESLYAAASPAQPRAEGWGHLVDAAPGGVAVGFGSPELAARGANGWLQVTGTGGLEVDCSVPQRAVGRCQALFHHITNPAQISAATSPPSMLHPLEVTLPAGWYRRCGVPRFPAPFESGPRGKSSR
jgi:hypothetical protein